MSHLTDTQTAFLNLRSQGYSYDKIAQDLRVSKHTLIRWAKELQPKIDAQFRAVFKKYQTALVHRVEFLSQQFQTMTNLITTCDPKSSAYPRYFNVLLKLHKTLEKFDVAPEPDDSTESAPSLNSEPVSTIPVPEPIMEEPASTKSAPESPSSNPEPSLLTAWLARRSKAPGTISAPDSSPSLAEKTILKYIEKYRNTHHQDPPQEVFQSLEQARLRIKEYQENKENPTRQAS